MSKIINPLSGFGFILTVLTLVLFFAAQFLPDYSIFSAMALPYGFFCALYFTVWVVFQYRTNEISVFNQSGSKYTYTRKKDKFWFLGIVTVCFVAGLFLSVVLGFEIVFDCSRSLINPCRS